MRGLLSILWWLGSGLSKDRRWVLGKDMFDHTGLRCAVFSLGKLTLVEGVVLGLQFAHLLDLVEVHHEALLVGVVRLDALSTEYGPMLRTIEVHNAIIVRPTKLVGDGLRTFIVEIDCRKERVTLHNFIENVDIQRQSLWRL